MAFGHPMEARARAKVVLEKGSERDLERAAFWPESPEPTANYVEKKGTGRQNVRTNPPVAPKTMSTLPCTKHANMKLLKTLRMPR